MSCSPASPVIKPVAGTSTLTVNAQTIDLESGRPSNFKPGDAQPGLDFSGFSQINLIASGDLRLGTLKVVNGLKTNGNDTSATAEQSSFTGKLVSAGDLLLSAQRIYPVSAVNFTIETPGNVKFAAPANSYTGIPLSAGGGITVYAGTIEQAGNLFAPLGKIALGNTDSAVSKIITQSVVLEPGSLTSVSLADTTVPYGATSDGTNWYYNANLNPLAQPPSKGLILAGSNVTRADGSTIDLRGGGDIQAMEWIAGKGGSRDSLTTTPSGQTVYALLPSQTDPIAAYDIHFATARECRCGQDHHRRRHRARWPAPRSRSTAATASRRGPIRFIRRTMRRCRALCVSWSIPATTPARTLPREPNCLMAPFW